MKKISILFLFFLFLNEELDGQWQFLGFGDQKINAIAVHPENPDVVFAGVEYIYKSQEGGYNWDTVSICPANFITFNPSNPDTMYFTFGLGSYSDGLYRSVDGGNSWHVLFWMTYANSVIIPSWPEGIIITGSKGYGVYRSDDYGNNWYAMNDSLDNLNILSLSTISPFGRTPIILAGTDSGIYRYINDYWIKTNAPNLTVPSIAMYNDVNPIIWSAIDGGSWSDGVYKSTDFGVTWSISTYWIYIRDVLVNPLDSNTIYAADSGYGVMISRDGGYNWDLINENLGDSVVLCLAQSQADTLRLYAGTQHGVYRYLVTGGTFEEEGDHEILIVENCIGSPLKISCHIPSDLSDKEVSIKLYDVSGRLVDVLFEGKSKPGLNTHIWNKNTSSGILLLNLRIGDLSITKKAILIR